MSPNPAQRNRDGASDRLVAPVVRTLAPTPHPDELLDERSAGVVLCKPPATLRDWRYRGIGPAYVKVGPRSVRYRRSDLETFVVASTVRPGGD